ncbi:MAG TPA: ATP-binding cassette domain-containing protein [Ilumatobacteraceae bacterium]|nr:ATP-binding cassette domain-containing protein [Ilumatobacteraceae bacterium]
MPDDLDDPSDASTPLVFDAVGLSMRGLTLLRDFSASVAAGETLAVMGPSGAGKTTLLRAIAGLVAPCAGSIRRAGRVAMVFRTRG